MRYDRSTETAFGLRQGHRRRVCRAVRRAGVRDFAHLLGILTQGACLAALAGLPATPAEAQCQYEVTIIPGPRDPVYGLPAIFPAWLEDWQSQRE